MNSSHAICKQDLLMSKLTEYFKAQDKLNIMLPIVIGESQISLRIIDWFVTNYSKKNNIMFKLNSHNFALNQFIVHTNYKSQLKAYSKKQFDPFCRRDRINFYYDKDHFITTTVGQLNFFRWAINNEILKYIEKNLKEIEEDMNLSVKHLYNNRKKTDNEIEDRPSRRKRQQLSISATRSISKHNVSMIVEFGNTTSKKKDIKDPSYELDKLNICNDKLVAN